MDTRSSTAAVAHRAFPEHDPLARFGDRVEGAVEAASVAVTLIGLPIAAAFGSEVYAAQTALSERRLRAGVPAPRVPARGGAVVADHGRGSAVRFRVDHAGPTVTPPPFTVEGAVVTAAAVAMGSWIALGGAMALGYVVVRSASTRFRSLWETERASAEPGWRKLT